MNWLDDIKLLITVFLLKIYYFYIDDCHQIIKQLHPKRLYAIMRYGIWEYGYEEYAGKPKCGIYYVYYDGHHIALHIGKFWIGVYY